MNYEIFISYRRVGGYETAKHLYDLLTRDGYTVSFDIDTLRNGDFDKELLSRIEQCNDFILILDKDVFTRTLDPDFDKNKDWLRNELAYALQKEKNIIPIMLSGFTEFPENLPDDIANVQKKNGPKYNQYYFDSFYEKLKKDFLTRKASEENVYDSIEDLEEKTKLEKYVNKFSNVVIAVLAICVLLSIGFAKFLHAIFNVGSTGMWIYGILACIALITIMFIYYESAMKKLMLKNFKNKNYEKAYNYAINIIANDGCNNVTEARNILGLIYFYGLGNKVDYFKANHWFDKAGETNSNALYHKGLIYLNGYGVKRDENQARQYFKKAASMGDILAQKALDKLN